MSESLNLAVAKAQEILARPEATLLTRDDWGRINFSEVAPEIRIFYAIANKTNVLSSTYVTHHLSDSPVRNFQTS
jgi:hypothetical protein